MCFLLKQAGTLQGLKYIIASYLGSRGVLVYFLSNPFVDHVLKVQCMVYMRMRVGNVPASFCDYSKWEFDYLYISPR